MTSRSKGEGFKEGLCDDSTKALVIKSDGRRESKIAQNCVTSFMNNPLNPKILSKPEDLRCSSASGRCLPGIAFPLFRQ